MIKKLLAILFLVVDCIVAYPFEKENAVNFVWEYAADKSEDYGGIAQCRVGVLENEVDTLFNRVVVEEGDEPASITDTIVVPKEHYIFFVASRGVMVGGGCQPVTYFFVSKQDSSYTAIESCGNFDEDYEWTIPYKSMLTRNAVVDTLKSKLDYIVGDNPCNIYFIDNYNDCDSALLSELSVENNNSWQFVIETADSSLFLLDMNKEMGINRVADYSEKSLNINRLNLDGLKLVYSNMDDGVRDAMSYDLSVYPNPATDHITVSLEDCILNLYSASGVLQRSVKSNSMSVSEIASGIYLLEIISNDRRICTRVVVK